MSKPRAIFLWLFLSACQANQSPEPAPPENPIIAEALKKWRSNQANTITWLSKQDPVIQIAVFQKIIGADAQAITKLCQTPELNALKQHCSLVENRPHLMVNPEKHNRKQPIFVLSSSKIEPSPLFKFSAQKTDCNPPTDLVCVYEKAQKAIHTSAEQVARTCNILEGISRAECYFKAADQLNGQNVPFQMQLCHAAQPYGDDCLAHLRDQFAQNLKSVADLDTPTIKNFQEIQDFFSLSKTPWHQDFAAVFWAETSFFLLKKTQPLCSNPLQKLPAEMKPHWRGALVYFKYKDSSPPDSATQRFQRLEEWSTLPCAHSTMNIADRTEVRYYWNDNYMLTTLYPNQLPYLRKGLRAYSSDEQIDAELIWLEAAAQHDDWIFVEKMMNSPVLEVSKRATQLNKLRKNYQIFP